MTSRKLIICLLASMVMRRLLLLKMRHISFLMLSVFPPIIYTSLYSYCIILRKSNYSLYIYIYIYIYIGSLQVDFRVEQCSIR